jgi:hypothetical protein
VLSIWGFRSGERAGGVDSGVGVNTLSGPGREFGGWSGALGNEFGGRGAGGAGPDNKKKKTFFTNFPGDAPHIPLSPLGFTRAGSASLGRGSVPCPRLCVQLPVASRLAGHTGARVPPWVLASSSGGGAVGDASLGFMVDFSGSPPMSARAQRLVGSSPALATP